MTKVKLKV